jgi:hypothetical protein
MPELDDVLNGTETTETVETTEIEKPEETEVTETAETTGEQVTAPPAVSEPEDMAGIKAAMIAERRARQAAEERARQLEAAQKPEEPPDFWEKPEEAINQKIAQVEQQFTTRFLNMSEAAARTRHADFDEKFEVFHGMAQQNPAMFQQMMAQPDPAEFVYQTAARVKAMQEMGDPASYRAKIEAEVRAKIEAEFTAKEKERIEAAIKAKLPPGFSESRNAGSPDKEGYAGPTPLKSILS